MSFTTEYLMWLEEKLGRDPTTEDYKNYIEEYRKESKIPIVNFQGERLLVRKEKYFNGRTALILVVLDTKEKYMTASVNLEQQPIRENYTFIKDYSENAGILQILIDAGLVETTGVEIRSGFVLIPEVKILF